MSVPAVSGRRRGVGVRLRLEVVARTGRRGGEGERGTGGREDHGGGGKRTARDRA